jgi:hypothetical protein
MVVEREGLLVVVIRYHLGVFLQRDTKLEQTSELTT